MDREQFHTYIDQYTRDLSRLSFHLCQNRTDAEDLYQETWLKAFNSFYQYDSSRPFDKWLFSICVNTYKNIIVSARVKREIPFQSNEEKDDFFSSLADDKKIDRSIEYQELYNLVEALTPKLKMVVFLYYFRDYTEKDVSEILNVPVGTVKSRLHKAKKKLKEAYENHER